MIRMNIPACWAISRMRMFTGRRDNSLYQEKQQMAAIQNRDGQKIDDRQVDAQKGNEKYQVDGAFPGLLPGQFGDHDRPSQGLGGYGSLEQFDDADNGEFGDIVGLP